MNLGYTEKAQRVGKQCDLCTHRQAANNLHTWHA